MKLNWIGPVPLTLWHVRRLPMGIAGVYALQAYSHVRGACAVVYVGQSDDVRRRLIEHLDSQRAKPILIAVRVLDELFFSAAPVLEPLQRARVESGLIRGLQPVCNTQRPRVQPLFASPPRVHSFQRG